MKTKPVVGQVIYDMPYSDTLRRSKAKGIKEIVVKKVGRKYFYAGEAGGPEHMDEKYLISSWEHVYDRGGAGSILYESKEAYLDEKLVSDIATRINRIFRHGAPMNVTTEDMLSAWDILKKYDKAKDTRWCNN